MGAAILALACTFQDGRAQGKPAKRSPSAAAKPEFQEAREAFEEGVTFLDSSSFDRAAEAFERSLAQRQSLPALYNLALAYRGLGKIKRALETVSRHLSLARSVGDTSAITQSEVVIAELKRHLAELTLVVSGSSDTVVIDGEAGAKGDRTEILTLDPGTHVFEAKRAGFAPVRRVVELRSGANPRIELDASRTPIFGRLLVETENPNAEIRVDGVPVARGRFDGRFALGPHDIEVNAPESKIWKQRVPITEGTDARVHVELEDERASITSAWWFWAAIGVVAAAGTAGVILAIARREPTHDGGGLNVTIGALSR
jgi:hypothetical protein